MNRQVEGLLARLGLKRARGKRKYALDEIMEIALEEQAEREQRPAEDLHADLVATALAQRQRYGELWQRWQALSAREQDVTAFTCLGYTNRQIFVVGTGLLFCLSPFIFSNVRGLSGLFIPGIPTLTTGILLFIASITSNWHIWAYLWPLEVISVALGFIFMTIFLKVPWLMIPASIIGLTGLVLQFCAATGWWSSWAVLWTVEPLAVGLPLLLIGMFKKIEGVKVAGIILCGFAGLAFAAMSSILVTSLWITRLIGPVIVLALGILLVVLALLKRPSEAKST